MTLLSFCEIPNWTKFLVFQKKNHNFDSFYCRNKNQLHKLHVSFKVLTNFHLIQKNIKKMKRFVSSSYDTINIYMTRDKKTQTNTKEWHINKSITILINHTPRILYIWSVHTYMSQTHTCVYVFSFVYLFLFRYSSYIWQHPRKKKEKKLSNNVMNHKRKKQFFLCNLDTHTCTHVYHNLSFFRYFIYFMEFGNKRVCYSCFCVSKCVCVCLLSWITWKKKHFFVLLS